MKTMLATVFFVFLLVFVAFEAVTYAWDVDLSRRQKRTVASEEQATDEATMVKRKPVVTKVEDLIKKATAKPITDRQELVVLNTPKGFVPSQIHVVKGANYLVHIVNVNEDKKNVSFMLDSFNQHHATFFGKIKSFELDPLKEGVYEFQCSETSATGRFIVQGMGSRQVSSEDK